MAFFLHSPLLGRVQVSFPNHKHLFFSLENELLGNNENCEGSNSRPFFYVYPTAQQPLLGPWYQNPAYNPLCVPGAGFTNGSLYFAYPVVLSEYPGFLVPQSPLPTALNRRPTVPMFYNTAQFQEYGGYGKKMKTKDTQTENEPQQAENWNEKHDMHSEGDSPDVGRVTNDETGEVYNENFKRCAKIKKTVKVRKLKDLSSFSNGKTVYLLKRSAVLTVVLREDSEDSELEEEVEDEMEEVECLLEEVSPQGPLTSSKGRSYRKAGSIIRMPPETSVHPQLKVWPTRNKYKLLQTRGEYEHVPVVYQLKLQDGCGSSGIRLRSKHTMAKPEGLQSRKASHKSMECT